MVTLAEHRFDDAVRLFGEARLIAETLHGLEHSVTLTYLAHEASALSRAGRPDEAFETNRRGHELVHEEDVTGVMFLTNLGLIEAQRKRYDRARGHLARALAITEKLHGREHVYVAEAATELGRVLVELGRPAEAKAQLTRAVAIFERRLGAEHPDLANALFLLGHTHLESGQPALAVPLLERALGIRERSASPPGTLEEVRELLNRARSA
jgi:serine/threonine-protein kinase